MLEKKICYQKLLDSISVGYAYSVVKKQGDGTLADVTFVETNRLFEQMTGLGARSGDTRQYGPLVLRRNFPTHGDLPEKIWRVAFDGSFERFEYHSMLFKRWYDVTLFSPEEGHVISLLSDITNHKISQSALERAEMRYLMLFENASDAIFIIKNDVFVDCNNMALKMFNCTKEQLMLKPPSFFSPLLQPDGVESDKKAGEKIEAARFATQHFEWLHIKFDGTPFYAEVSLNSTEIMGEELVQAIVRDITERKINEERLKKSEQKYRQLYESMMDAFACVDMSGRIVEFNREFCDMLGYSEKELHGMTYQEITPDAWHAFEQEIIEREVLVRGYSRVYVKEYRHKNGTFFPVELRTSLVLDENGKPSQMWAIIRDIRERYLCKNSL